MPTLFRSLLHVIICCPLSSHLLAKNIYIYIKNNTKVKIGSNQDLIGLNQEIRR